MYKVFQERREDKKRDFCTCNIWMGPSFFVSLDNLPQSEWIGLVFQYLVPCVVLEPHYSIDQIYNGLVGKGNANNRPNNFSSQTLQQTPQSITAWPKSTSFANHSLTKMPVLSFTNC